MDIGFLTKETLILEETVQILSQPQNYGISVKDLFTVLNCSSSMFEAISGGLRKGSVPGSVSTKMVDFQNLVALGQQLADNRNTSHQNIDHAIDSAKRLHHTLSTHVYINHVGSNTAQSWKDLNNEINSKKDQESIGSASSTNPLESQDYFPDLRLVMKNILVLLISFLKRYQLLLTEKYDQTLVQTLKELILLVNVSILNKLYGVFKMLNPHLDVKSQKDLFTVF